MPQPRQQDVRNRLLSLMAPRDFDKLSPHLTRVRLPTGMVIAKPDEPVEQVYFPDTGMISMVAVSPQGLEVEAGVFGREGLGSAGPVMGVDSAPLLLNVQIEGEGWRIERENLTAAMGQSASLQATLLRYVQTQIVQTSYSALTNAVHQVDQRLARWLLMSDDRSDSGDLKLTHEFLSVMLAVRRPTVTNALHVLEGLGLIRADRGYIQIRDRQAMEHFAADAYGQPEAAYEKLIGPLRPPR